MHVLSAFATCLFIQQQGPQSEVIFVTFPQCTISVQAVRPQLQLVIYLFSSHLVSVVIVLI